MKAPRAQRRGGGGKAIGGAIAACDLAGDERHVIFGGAGRAYDRNVFHYLALEQSSGAFPSYERMRNRAALWNHEWNTSATVSCVESKDGIVIASTDEHYLFRGDPGVPNPAFGRATQYAQPTRTSKLSVSLTW